MRKNAKENIIVVCTIVLCFMLTLALCLVLSGEGLLSVFKNDKSEKCTFYAVATGGYTDITLARNNAELVKQRGGAGYVIAGDSIELIFAVYKSEGEANSALSALGNRSAYIKKIEIEKGGFKWCKDDLKTAEKEALGYFDLAYDKLFEVSSALNDGKMALEDAKTQIKVLYAQIEDIKSAFYQNTVGCDKDEITQTKLALVTTLALLDNIDWNVSLPVVTSSIRYQIVQLVLCRQALMKSI